MVDRPDRQSGAVLTATTGPEYLALAVGQPRADRPKHYGFVRAGRCCVALFDLMRFVPVGCSGTVSDAFARGCGSPAPLDQWHRHCVVRWRCDWRNGPVPKPAPSVSVSPIRTLSLRLRHSCSIWVASPASPPNRCVQPVTSNTRLFGAMALTQGEYFSAQRRTRVRNIASQGGLCRRVA